MSPKKPEPITTAYRYVGPFDAWVHFHSTRRTFCVAPGDILDLLPSEVEGLVGRTDFQPADTDFSEE